MTPYLMWLKEVEVLKMPFLASAFYYFYWLTNDQWHEDAIHVIFKSLPIICLMFYVNKKIFSSQNLRRYKGNDFLSAAHIRRGLIFSVIGDAFLVWENDSNFLCGLIAFAVSHLCYIKAQESVLDPLLRKKVLVTTIITLLSEIVVLAMLLGANCTFFIPVALYQGLMCFEIWQAVQCFRILKTTHSEYMMLGSVLFAISDALIAYDRFLNKFSCSYALIMATYYAAQYCITMSSLSSIHPN